MLVLADDEAGTASFVASPGRSRWDWHGARAGWIEIGQLAVLLVAMPLLLLAARSRTPWPDSGPFVRSDCLLPTRTGDIHIDAKARLCPGPAERFADGDRVRPKMSAG